MAASPDKRRASLLENREKSILPARRHRKPIGKKSQARKRGGLRVIASTIRGKGRLPIHGARLLRQIDNFFEPLALSDATSPDALDKHYEEYAVERRLAEELNLLKLEAHRDAFRDVCNRRRGPAHEKTP